MCGKTVSKMAKNKIKITQWHFNYFESIHITILVLFILEDVQDMNIKFEVFKFKMAKKITQWHFNYFESIHITVLVLY